MGVLSAVHAPGRYANLRRIQQLDPEVDYDEIVRLTARHEFPWDYVQGTGIAFMRDYGVPSIAALLDRTREFEDHGVKRYDDTILIGDEATLDGIDSPRSHAALRRLNRIHGHYDIPDEELAYVLATTIVGPVRWISAYGWRPLDPHELVALAKVTTRFGELMGIKDLPTTYDGYLALLVDYERQHFAHTPASTRLAEASIRIARTVAPAPLKPLTRRVMIAVMDEPLREALGLPRQPRWFVRAVHAGLRLRGRVLRFAPPRRTPYRHRPTTYPGGYRLADLGPIAMLDDLNRVAGAANG
ncbi:oxygenase MpaB family protein [Nocardioides astragali]|uniref:Oxygenase MpaB family protein n=1 Tax=Nocardioides astragali TaxID=1776736 RepID=A0ABW2N3Y6_9ACTN|nr:oxygenase MpaB family protein [Nocardioides astragali]